MAHIPPVRRPARRPPHGPWQAPAVALATLTALLMAIALPGTALAHERRQVGPYTLVVGFLEEPALAGQLNGVDLRITRTDGGEPVLGAENTLKVAIAFGGGQPREFPLRARFGQPGAYTADLIPTRPGSYLFTFSGTVEGTPVNQRFESGPGRFNDVEPAEKLQFPEAAPAPEQLAAAMRGAEERAAAAEGRARQALVLGAAGSALGLLGLGLGALAWRSARRTAGVTNATRAAGAAAHS